MSAVRLYFSRTQQANRVVTVFPQKNVDPLLTALRKCISIIYYSSISSYMYVFSSLPRQATAAAAACLCASLQRRPRSRARALLRGRAGARELAVVLHGHLEGLPLPVHAPAGPAAPELLIVAGGHRAHLGKRPTLG